MSIAYLGQGGVYLATLLSCVLFLKPSRSVLLSVFFSLFLSLCMLLYAHVFDNFELLNVFLHSHTQKPLLYKIAGIWASHEGSILLLITIIAFVFTIKKDDALLLFQGAFLSLLLFFCLFWCQPFEVIDSPSLLEGLGMNPLLQSPLLAIHPTVLYLGYAFASHTFLKTLYEVLFIKTGSKNYLKRDIVQTWFFISLGIVLGSLWAYQELGWGGYWFWDPVETISLLPWLGYTISFHLCTLKKQESYQTLNQSLIFISYNLSFLGIVFVRSGLLNSVHSFAFDPQKGIGLFSLYMLLTIVMVSSLFKKGSFQQDQKEIFKKQKHLFLGMSTLFLFLSCLLFTTIFPVILSFFDHSISISPIFYNKLFSVVALPVLWLMFLSTPLRKQYYKSIFLLSTFCTIFVYTMTSFKDFLNLGVFFCLLLGLFSTTLHLYKFKKLTKQTFGHLGVYILGFGIFGNAYFSQSYILYIKEKEELTQNSQRFKLEKVIEGIGPNYSFQEAHLFINDTVTTPQRRTFLQQESTYHKISTKNFGFLHQLYVHMGQKLEENKWSFQVHVQKYIYLILVGALLIIFSLSKALWGKKDTG